MPGQGLCRDMLGPSFVPQTPLRGEEDGAVKRPNRMSLLVAGRSGLFDTNESVLDAVTDSPVCSYTVPSSPNPIGLVHRIADLQEALRKVTEELDSTKKTLQEAAVAFGVLSACCVNDQQTKKQKLQNKKNALQEAAMALGVLSVCRENDHPPSKKIKSMK